MKFAATTSVPVHKSRGEIETMLMRYGATAFASGADAGRAMIQFSFHGRLVRFVLALPARDDKRFARDGRGAIRSAEKRAACWEQACRSLWRALALVVKAKLEATAAGISTVESEFLPWTVLPNGRTVAEEFEPQVAAMVESGRMPKLLLAGGAS